MSWQYRLCNLKRLQTIATQSAPAPLLSVSYIPAILFDSDRGHPAPMNGGQPTKTKQRSAVGSRVVTEGTTIAKCVAKLLLRLPRQLQCPFVRASTLRPPLLPERRLLVSIATRGLYVRHENSFGTSLLGLNLVLARAVLIASVRLMQTTQSPRTCANRRTTIPARKFSRITFIESLDLSRSAHAELRSVP